MPSSQRKRPSQKRSQDTIEKILDATAHLLARDGYRSLTTNRVAERAEVSVGTVYRYFSDKGELLVAVGDRASADITRRLIATIGKSVALEPRTGVRLVVEILVDALIANRGIITAMVGEIPLGNQSNVLPDVEQQLAHFARLYLAYHRPELPETDIEEIVYIGMGVTLNAALRTAIDKPPTFDRQRLIDRTANLLTTGLLYSEPAVTR